MSEWTESDAASLRRISMEPVWGRFIEQLKQRRPKLGGKTTEEKGLNAAVAEGHEGVLDEIDRLLMSHANKAQRSHHISVSEHKSPVRG